AGDLVADLVRKLELPARLRDVGVTREQLDLIAQNSMHDRAIATNPRKIRGPEDVREILDRAWWDDPSTSALEQADSSGGVNARRRAPAAPGSTDSERTNRGDDFLCRDNSGGVVRHVDVERGVHHLVRVIRRRVSYHGDLVAEFGGIAHGRFDAGMRDQADDDQLMDAVLLELQIQVGVGETAGAPMFLRDDLTRRRHEFGAEFTAPGAVFEALVLPRRPLDRRDVLPRLVIARTVAMMHGIEDPKLRLARGIQNFQHMGNAV